MIRSIARFMVCGMLLAGAGVPGLAADGAKIRLKLFSLDMLKQNSGNYRKGCMVDLWQHNKDRWDDKFPFVFHWSLADPEEFVNPVIKVGDDFIELERIATGGGEKGYRLHPHQLFRSLDGKYHVIMNLTLVEEPGEVIEVTKGAMTVIHDGKPPFRVPVAGAGGCL